MKQFGQQWDLASQMVRGDFGYGGIFRRPSAGADRTVLPFSKQNIDPEYRAQLLKKLPRNLKTGLERAFSQRFETKVIRPGDPPAEKGLEEIEFWRKANAESDLRKVLDQGEREARQAQAPQGLRISLQSYERSSKVQRPPKV